MEYPTLEPIGSGVHIALALIENAQLPHPSSALLSSFVTEALNPAAAANYVRDRLSVGEIASVVSDWQYIVECGTSSFNLVLLMLMISVSQSHRTPPPPDVQTQHEIRSRDGHRCCITGKRGSLWDPLVVVPISPVPTGWISEKVLILTLQS